MRATTPLVGCPSSGSVDFGFRKFEPWTKDFGFWSSGFLPDPSYGQRHDFQSCRFSFFKIFQQTRTDATLLLRLGSCTVVGFI